MNKFKNKQMQHLYDLTVKWSAPKKKRNKRLTKKLYYIKDFNKAWANNEL